MSHPPSTIDAARAYIERGWRVVQIKPRSKRPVRKDWPTTIIAVDQLSACFGNGANIGVALGKHSGALVDVDLDCNEAIALADSFLPHTPCITGREGSPSSHRWFIAAGAATKQHHFRVTKEQKAAGKKADMIVELRSTGAQTIVGPSEHPDGGHYDVLAGEPAVVDAAALTAAVKALAKACREQRDGPQPEAPPRVPKETLRLAEGDFTERAEARAVAYLAKMPHAVSGEGGHNATYAAATALVHGFELPPAVALRILHTDFNTRCVPPWSDRELEHKVNDAVNKPHALPRGWLLRAERHADAPKADICAIIAQGKAAIESAKSQAEVGLPARFLEVPGFIGNTMAYNLATAHRPQPILALAGALTLQCVLAGRKVRDQRGNRTNLYCIGIAPSGVGKEHARQVSRKVLAAAELGELEGPEDMASDAGLIAAVAHSPACLVQIDEIGRLLQSIGDAKRNPHLYNVLTVLMKLYSTAPTEFKGKGYSDRKNNVTIEQPCLVLYGTTIPENFYAGLGARALEDGFVARLALFEGASFVPRQVATEQPVPAELVDVARWWGAYTPNGNLGHEYPMPEVVGQSDDARREFNRLGEQVDVALRGNQPGAKALWARAEERACRFALAYACSANHEQPYIDANAAQWACGLSAWMTARMLAIANDWICDGEHDAASKRVLRLLKESGGSMSRTALCRKTQSMKPRDREAVMEGLFDAGMVVRDDLPTTERGGRPGIRYVFTGAGVDDAD